MTRENMKIDWNPSPETLALAHKVHEWKKTMTYEQISKVIGYHRTYLIALNNLIKKAEESK